MTNYFTKFISPGQLDSSQLAQHLPGVHAVRRRMSQRPELVVASADAAKAGDRPKPEWGYPSVAPAKLAGLYSFNKAGSTSTETTANSAGGVGPSTSATPQVVAATAGVTPTVTPVSSSAVNVRSTVVIGTAVAVSAVVKKPTLTFATGTVAKVMKSGAASSQKIPVVGTVENGTATATSTTKARKSSKTHSGMQKSHSGMLKVGGGGVGSGEEGEAPLAIAFARPSGSSATTVPTVRATPAFNTGKKKRKKKGQQQFALQQPPQLHQVQAAAAAATASRGSGGATTTSFGILDEKAAKQAALAAAGTILGGSDVRGGAMDRAATFERDLAYGRSAELRAAHSGGGGERRYRGASNQAASFWDQYGTDMRHGAVRPLPGHEFDAYDSATAGWLQRNLLPDASAGVLGTRPPRPSTPPPPRGAGTARSREADDRARSRLNSRVGPPLGAAPVQAHGGWHSHVDPRAVHGPGGPVYASRSEQLRWNAAPTYGVPPPQQQQQQQQQQSPWGTPPPPRSHQFEEAATPREVALQMQVAQMQQQLAQMQDLQAVQMQGGGNAVQEQPSYFGEPTSEAYYNSEKVSHAGSAVRKTAAGNAPTRPASPLAIAFARPDSSGADGFAVPTVRATPTAVLSSKARAAEKRARFLAEAQEQAIADERRRRVDCEASAAIAAARTPSPSAPRALGRMLSSAQEATPTVDARLRFELGRVEQQRNELQALCEQLLRQESPQQQPAVRSPAPAPTREQAIFARNQQMLASMMRGDPLAAPELVSKRSISSADLYRRNRARLAAMMDGGGGALPLSREELLLSTARQLDGVSSPSSDSGRSRDARGTARLSNDGSAALREYTSARFSAATAAVRDRLQITRSADVNAAALRRVNVYDARVNQVLEVPPNGWQTEVMGGIRIPLTSSGEARAIELRSARGNLVAAQQRPPAPPPPPPSPFALLPFDPYLATIGSGTQQQQQQQQQSQQILPRHWS